jgi:hypothetical protein
MNIKSSCYRGKPGFIAVVALLLSSSALPVKSDAFSIIRGGSSRMATHSTIKLPVTQPKNVVLVPSLDDRSSSAALYAEVVAPNDYGLDILPSLAAIKEYIEKARTFVSRNFFLVGMIFAVSFARLLPELGKNGSIVRPELFIGKYGVTTIFLLSGLSIKLKEL